MKIQILMIALLTAAFAVSPLAGPGGRGSEIGNGRAARDARPSPKKDLIGNPGISILEADVTQGIVSRGEVFELRVKLRSSLEMDSVLVQLSLETEELELPIEEEVYIGSELEKLEQNLVDGVLSLKIPLFVRSDEADRRIREVHLKGITIRNRAMQEAVLEFPSPIRVQVD